MTKKMKSQTFEDPHVGVVRFRPLTPNQLKRITEKLDSLDLDAEIAKLPDNVRSAQPAEDLRQSVRSTLWMQEVLRRAISDQGVRHRLGISGTEPESFDKADGEAFHRVGTRVLNASGAGVSA